MVAGSPTPKDETPLRKRLPLIVGCVVLVIIIGGMLLGNSLRGIIGGISTTTSEDDQGNIIVRGSAQQAALDQAKAQAQQEWPQFTQAFAKRHSGQTFTVKAPFVDGTNTEHMWVQVEELNNQTVTGELQNDPQYVHNLENGDNVCVKISEVEDWIYSDGEKTLGGYSVKVLTGKPVGEVISRSPNR